MRFSVFALSAAVLVAAGCKKAGEETPSPAPVATPAPAPAPPAPPPPPPIAPRISGPMGEVLDAYDAMRLQLAHDDLDAARSSARSVASAAREAAGAAADKQPLTDLASAADKMSGAKDLAAARDAFGDVSKQVVTLVAANAALQTGRFLFECPMAKGYQKWVQTTKKLENPYFGKEMTTCGTLQDTWAP